MGMYETAYGYGTYVFSIQSMYILGTAVILRQYRPTNVETLSTS